MAELKADEYDSEDEPYSEADYELDHCYECTGYGDDYYIDENGELVSACTDCPFNSSNIGQEDET
jgi:hypothetical protein